MLYDLIIFLNLAYDSAQNEIFFVKIKIRVLNLWLDETFGPKMQKKLVSRHHTTNVIKTVTIIKN